MTIPKLEVKGETLINVPTDKLILLELGLSENEATVAIEQYEQQQELKKTRHHRQHLLIQADHLVNQAMDRELDPEPFRTYRQQLRDITQPFKPYSEIEWPDKPVLPE
ncbi:phage tail assembly chaperone [Vibrio azureus]|uniref:Phage tail assembly chaperone-like domain-containing protein n=1 Tax=Vibrio azureus NBRC 104587 TaxID=1219077 RepID=U3AL87_9VIBR|nr:phage tail assembly chaperone [Vibrio azureus]GAD74535.1 hypothetical protein VAZ01S_012_00140 [Vibrio azureus NBRC 104587]